MTGKVSAWVSGVSHAAPVHCHGNARTGSLPVLTIASVDAAFQQPGVPAHRYMQSTNPPARAQRSNR